MAITEADARALGWGQHFACGRELVPVHDEGWIQIYKMIHWVELGADRDEYDADFEWPRFYLGRRIFVISIGRYEIIVHFDRDRTPPF